MKGKLIKTDKGYILEGDNLPNPRRLSIKNCEAIELGYDLDELSKEETRKFLGHDVPENIMLFITHNKMFQKGFQTALEILGDNKFSKYDMLDFAEFFMNLTDKSKPFQKLKDWESLQQTEWQVEVVMDRIPADLAPDGWDVFPKLDAEGCLILKK